MSLIKIKPTETVDRRHNHRNFNNKSPTLERLHRHTYGILSVKRELLTA